MPTDLKAFATPGRAPHKGVSLLELIVFIVIVASASAVLFKVYTQSLIHSADPLEQVRAFELAQSKLDEVLAVKYDANTPTGGIPACDSAEPGALVCNNTPDSTVDDIDDYDASNIIGGVSAGIDVPYTGYTRTVTVTAAGNEKLISVAVATPRGQTITLAAYRANF